jgi:hypothetical protein
MISSMLLGLGATAQADYSITIGTPGLSIGINQPSYPNLVRVPDYPVYYAPQAGFNLFFYDGMYWAFANDEWYASTWYNGPWGRVVPQYVPVYVLRVPVVYYRRPPAYFRGWSKNEPPRWGQHYGPQWQQQRHGWDTWDRRSAPPPAPLPVFQRQYAGDHYPSQQQQPVIQSQHYRYEPSEPVVREHYERHGYMKPPAQQRPQPSTQQHESTPPPAKQHPQQSQPQHESTPPPPAKQHPQQSQPQHESSPPQPQPQNSSGSGKPEKDPKDSKGGKGHDKKDEEGGNNGKGNGNDQEPRG